MKSKYKAFMSLILDDSEEKKIMVEDEQRTVGEKFGGYKLGDFCTEVDSYSNIDTFRTDTVRTCP